MRGEGASGRIGESPAVCKKKKGCMCTLDVQVSCGSNCRRSGLEDHEGQSRRGNKLTVTEDGEKN